MTIINKKNSSMPLEDFTSLDSERMWLSTEGKLSVGTLTTKQQIYENAIFYLEHKILMILTYTT
jgi:hypothetical protein